LRLCFSPLPSGDDHQGWRVTMNIKHRQVDGVTVVNLSGRLDSATSGDVMDQLNGPVNAGATRLIVNLKDLTYISSAGLRSILVAAKMTKTLNGGMRLCEPNALVSKTLEVSGFDNLIKIDSLESQSLEAFRGDRPPAS
jgi:anti-sigma B factor antagonist